MLARSISPIQLMPNELELLSSYLSDKLGQADQDNDIFNAEDAGRLFFCESGSSDKEKRVISQIDNIFFHPNRTEDRFFNFLNKVVQENWPEHLDEFNIINMRSLLKEKVLNQMLTHESLEKATQHIKHDKKIAFNKKLSTAICFALIFHQQKRFETIPELKDKIQCLSKIAVYENSVSSAIDSLKSKIYINFHSRLDRAFFNPKEKSKTFKDNILAAFQASKHENFYPFLKEIEADLWGQLFQHMKELTKLEPKKLFKILKLLKKNQSTDIRSGIQQTIDELNLRLKKSKSQSSIQHTSQSESSEPSPRLSNTPGHRVSFSQRLFRDVPRLEQLSARSRSNSDPGTPTPTSKSSDLSD